MALAHVTLATRELARSTAFFHEVMGWTPIGRPRNNAVARRLATNRAWAGTASGRGSRFPTLAIRARVRPAHRGQLPASRFPALKERLIAHGAKVIDPLRDTPFDRFFFRDPNGYLFEVLEEERAGEADEVTGCTQPGSIIRISSEGDFEFRSPSRSGYVTWGNQSRRINGDSSKLRVARRMISPGRVASHE